MLQTAGAVVGAGWQSGKFLYVDTDLKIDLPEARVVIDRDQVADLGLDLPAWAASSVRCWAARTSTGSTITTAATRSSPRSATSAGPRWDRCSISRSRRRVDASCPYRPSRTSSRARRRAP